MKYNSKLYPFESKWVSMNGVNIHYIDEGAGQVILFSHAAIGSSFMYRRFIIFLSKHFRCVALDFPGFGLSDNGTDSKHSIVDQSKVLTFLIQQLKLKDIIALGHDTGGPSLYNVCIKRPELFKGLILTDTIIFPTIEYPKVHRMLRIIGSAPFRWFNKHTNLMLRLTVNQGVFTRKLSKVEKKVYYKMTANTTRRMNIIEVLYSLRENFRFMAEIKEGFENQLRDKPMLLICGEKDPVKLLGITDRIHNMMPHSELFLIKGEAHFPHEGQPERMSEIIYQWIRDQIVGTNAQVKNIQSLESNY